jgi:predicted DNA binding CopG/RHH family protein
MSKIPQFNSEIEESEFWDTHDFTDFLEETTLVEAKFVDARPRKVLISLRLAPETIEGLKVVSRRKGLGYQTLMRRWIEAQLALELTSPDSAALAGTPLEDRTA